MEQYKKHRSEVIGIRDRMSQGMQRTLLEVCREQNWPQRSRGLDWRIERGTQSLPSPQDSRRGEKSVPPLTRGAASPTLVDRVCRRRAYRRALARLSFPTPPTRRLREPRGRSLRGAGRPKLHFERARLPIDEPPCVPRRRLNSMRPDRRACIPATTPRAPGRTSPYSGEQWRAARIWRGSSDASDKISGNHDRLWVAGQPVVRLATCRRSLPRSRPAKNRIEAAGSSRAFCSARARA